MKEYLLLNRRILKINGENILNFLQGLITNDVDLLKTKNAIYSAMLTPNGRFLYDFFILNHENEIFIDIADVFQDGFIGSINKFKLRQKINIELMENYTIISSNDVKNYAILSFQDIRNINLGFRNIVNFTQLKSENFSTPEKYNSLLINNLIVDGRFIPIEKGIILEYGFEKLNGVSFSKGCYLGQELITRTKRTGEIRKKLILSKYNKDEDFITHDGENGIKIERLNSL